MKQMLKCCVPEYVLCFLFLQGAGRLGESCIWQGLAGGNVEVFKDFYSERVFLRGMPGGGTEVLRSRARE